MTLSRRAFLSSVTSVAALWAMGFPAMASERQFALAGTVIVGDGTDPLPNHAVLIDDDIISAIVPVGEVRDREFVGSNNDFIMPGIINCHCHRIHTSDDRRERYLRHGVTSIGDTASPLTALPELLQSPAGNTATTICAGPMLCPPGGYPLPVHNAGHGMEITTPAKGREAVQRLADLGAGMIKIAFEPGVLTGEWPMFDATTAGDICDEARKHGLIVRCHTEDFSGLKLALDAGVHTVEHVPYRWRHKGTSHPILVNGELIPQYRKQLERMVRDEVILTPTLDVLSRSMWNGPRLYEPVRYFQELGGKVALGNDHPYRRTEAGVPLKEMELLGIAGLTPIQVITAGTHHSAMACGFRSRGVLSPGMKADIVITTNDPLEGLDVIAHPALVIKDGKFVELTD